jgi:hypothetical protein
MKHHSSWTFLGAAGIALALGLAATPAATAPLRESCQGDRACEDNTGKISRGSCNGDFACAQNEGRVGQDACNGDSACIQNEGRVGRDACNGPGACEVNAGRVGQGACSDEQACLGNLGNVGRDSCNGLGACRGLPDMAKIGPGSCNDQEACMHYQGESIARDACNDLRACRAGSGNGLVQRRGSVQHQPRRRCPRLVHRGGGLPRQQGKDSTGLLQRPRRVRRQRR